MRRRACGVPLAWTLPWPRPRRPRPIPGSRRAGGESASAPAGGGSACGAGAASTAGGSGAWPDSRRRPWSTRADTFSARARKSRSSPAASSISKPSKGASLSEPRRSKMAATWSDFTRAPVSTSRMLPPRETVPETRAWFFSSLSDRACISARLSATRPSTLAISSTRMPRGPRLSRRSLSKSRAVWVRLSMSFSSWFMSRENSQTLRYMPTSPRRVSRTARWLVPSEARTSRASRACRSLRMISRDASARFRVSPRTRSRSASSMDAASVLPAADSSAARTARLASMASSSRTFASKLSRTPSPMASKTVRQSPMRDLRYARSSS